jgi:hypothetical protein
LLPKPARQARSPLCTRKSLLATSVEKAATSIPDNGGSCRKVSNSIILHLISHRQNSVVREDCTGAARSYLLFLLKNSFVPHSQRWRSRISANCGKIFQLFRKSLQTFERFPGGTFARISGRGEILNGDVPVLLTCLSRPCLKEGGERKRFVARLTRARDEQAFAPQATSSHQRISYYYTPIVCRLQHD